jgi:hypothetical protein
MITKLPVDFKSKVQNGSDAQISASDLMNNFSATFIEIDTSLVTDVASPSGHTQRKLKIPGLPASGSTFLNALSGGLQWSAMPTATTSSPPAPTGPSIPTPPASGTYVLGAVSGSLQWLTTISC